MLVWGINALNHGNSLAVFRDRDLIFYRSGTSDDLDAETVSSALYFGRPEKIYWYENPWMKKLRQIRAGQWDNALDLSVLPKNYLKNIELDLVDLKYTPHHASHAAAGYYTSPFDTAAIVVLDAIGEFECASIWQARDGNLKKLWSRNYPNSLGLFYSAFTKLIGYQPITQEHLLQKDSESGDPDRFYHTVSAYFSDTLIATRNLHRGVWDWSWPINNTQDKLDVAAAVQRVFEEQVEQVMLTAQRLTGEQNLIYMGGCAMNSKYNQRLKKQWRGIWSLPNPGDPSSSLGAVLYHSKQKVHRDLGIVKHLEIRV